MMEAIVIETKETIALKKKQIEENQSQVNQMTLEMATKVNKILHLGSQVEQLQRELYQLEHKIVGTPAAVSSVDGCSMNKDLNRSL